MASSDSEWLPPTSRGCKWVDFAGSLCLGGTWVLNKKLLSRSLSSIHILYNHTPAAPLRPHPELFCGLLIFYCPEVVAKTHTARFEGKASSRSFERSGCDEALAVGKPHLVSPHVPCLLDAPRDVALMGVVVGCPVEKKIAPAYCGECRSLRQGCMPRTRDSEQAGCPLIAATGSGRRDVFIRSNRSAR